MGKKYIIELEDEANGLFKAKGFNTLVFDKNGISKLTPYEEKEEKPSWKPEFGAKAAWQRARTILSMKPETRQRLFGNSDIEFIFRMFSVFEANKILDDYLTKEDRLRKALSLFEGYEMTNEEIGEFIESLRKKQE